MTDRYNALIVILDRDIREDDAEPLITAIRMLKGVLKVEPHLVEIGSAISEARVRADLGEKIWAIIHPDVK